MSIPGAGSCKNNSHHWDRWLIIWLVIFGVLLTASFWKYPKALPSTKDPDALKFLSFNFSLFDAMRHYGEFPLWNPYFGGGIAWSGAVCNTGLSIQSLIYIACGEIIGIKIWIITILILGGCGMYGTLRGWFELGPLASFFGAMLYMSSSWFTGVIQSGDYDLHAFFSLPFAMLCMLWLLQGRYAGLLLPVCYMTWLADETKFWPFIAMLIVLVVAIACRSASQRSFRDTVLLWSAAFACGIALSAWKLLPFIEHFKADLVDQIAQRRWLCYKSFIHILRSVLFPGVERVTNYYMSIGPGGALFVVIAVLLYFRRSLWLLVMLTVAAIFALGPQSPLPIVTWTSSLPLLNKMGNLGIYLSLPMLFCTCSLAALGVEGLSRLTITAELKKSFGGLLRRIAGWLIVAIMIVNIAYLVVAAESIYSVLFNVMDTPPLKEGFYQIAYRRHIGKLLRYREPPTYLPEVNQYFNIRRGIGTITWLGNMVFAERPKAAKIFDESGIVTAQEGYRGEVYSDNPSDGRFVAKALRVSYNTVRFRANNSKPTTIVLNMNYARGWSSLDGEIINRDGLLAVRIPAGSARYIRLQFRDNLFFTGLGVTVVAGILWLVVGMRRIRRRRASVTNLQPQKNMIS